MTTQTTDFPDIEIGDDDPLADLGLDLGDEITAIHEACDNAAADEINKTGVNRVSEWLGGKPTGEPLYLDIETIPDFDRMFLFDLEPLPVMPPVDTQEQLLPTDQFITMAIPEIESWLAKHNPPREWIDGVLDAEKQSKKPRKGFLDAIDTHRKRIASIANAEADRIKYLSVRPLYCKIVSIAFAVGKSKPVSMVADGKIPEAHLLEQAWRMIARHTPVIGYGVSFFDIQVILARSMILGVRPSKFLDRRKYGSRDIVDLCRDLFNDDRSITVGLKAVCKALGINPSSADCNGSHVYEMWKAQDYAGIAKYNESDVELTQRLHMEKMAGYFCV